MHDLPSLARELGLLQARAARGTGTRGVSLTELTRRLGWQTSSRSTVHSYVSGKTLAPADVLDQIVIALGATPDEQREWSEAWFRAAAEHRQPRRTGGTATPAQAVVAELQDRLEATAGRRFDFCAVSAQNMDLVNQVDRIEPDHEAELSAPLACPGGSGSNTTLAITRLGARTAIVGAVADDEYGHRLRQDLATAGVDTDLLRTVDGTASTGWTQVFIDGEGRRFIGVHAGVNEQLAAEFESCPEALADVIVDSRILHLSSFTGVAERDMQESLVRDIDRDTVLTFSPGTLYSRLGADRISNLLTRCNVLFVYEQQLDLLLANSSAGAGADIGSDDVTRKMDLLFQWRAQRGSREPLVIVAKRPVELVGGRSREYLSLGFGTQRLEDVGGPDAGSRRQDVLDSTGAGDALAAGFLFGLLSGGTSRECGNLAFVMALSVSAGLGARATQPTRAEIARRWREYLPAAPLPPLATAH